MNKIQRKRLEKLATILDTADAEHRKNSEPKYYQGVFTHPCGTPACALGHYAAASPKRWAIIKETSFELWQVPQPRLKLSRGARTEDDATDEFGLTIREYEELFGGVGCGEAKTAKQAARYIRKFLTRKDKEAAK
jgi:hypothetical protein